MHSTKANLTTVSRENSVQLGTNCTAKKLRHLSFPFVCCEMATMIVYDVHTVFCMSPLVKGRLVVVPNLVSRVSRFKKRKDKNPFRFLLSYRARNVGIKGAGDLEEEKKRGRLDSLFSFALSSPSLLFLRLPHRLPVIVFFCCC